MERGDLGIDNGPTTMFVFDELIATCVRPKIEKVMLSGNRWSAALGCWDFNILVMDTIHDMLSRFQARIEVITWRPPGFAEVLYDRMWELDVPVSDVHSPISYMSISQRIATDPSVNAVFDADPRHRLGYGFKCREFTPGQM